MTTPAQLRLAADILETGHPFAFGSGTTWNRAFDSTPFDCLKGGYQVRPVLATPPYPAQLHNPDNLTADQVGVGYRLLCKGESDCGLPKAHPGHRKCEGWSNGSWDKGKDNGIDIYGVGYRSFHTLSDDGSKLRRRGSDAWEPCSKEAAV